MSLPRTSSAQPAPLSAAAVGAIVTKHAVRAQLPSDRLTAQVLRHTFCTLLAERGVALEVIAELAGHADVRTTRAYVSVAQRRCADAIEVAFTRGAPALRRPADRPEPVGGRRPGRHGPTGACLLNAGRPASSFRRWSLDCWQ